MRRDSAKRAAKKYKGRVMNQVAAIENPIGSHTSPVNRIPLVKAPNAQEALQVIEEVAADSESEYYAIKREDTP